MTAVPETHLGWVKDPEALAGLIRTRPDADQHPVIVGRYDRTPKGGRKDNENGPWIWCCHCQASTHWNGFVVTDDAGTHFLIGQDCGAKHYGGERFRAAKRQFESIENARYISERLFAIRDLSTSVEGEITTLLASAELAAIDKKRAEIQAASSQAADRLVTYAKAGLSLTAHERARGVRGAGFISANIGPLEGPALIFSDVRARCTELKQAVVSAVAVTKDEDASAKDQKVAVDLVENAARDVLRAVVALSQAHRFFLKRNQRRLARWSTAWVKFFTFLNDDDNLVIIDTEKGTRTIAPLDQQRFPTLKSCKGLIGE